MSARRPSPPFRDPPCQRGALSDVTSEAATLYCAAVCALAPIAVTRFCLTDLPRQTSHFGSTFLTRHHSRTLIPAAAPRSCSSSV
eukprot:3601820-Amphidinium_carterae.1